MGYAFDWMSSIWQIMSSKVVYSVVMKWMSLCRYIFESFVIWLDHMSAIEWNFHAVFSNSIHCSCCWNLCLFNLLFVCLFLFQVLLSFVWCVANQNVLFDVSLLLVIFNKYIFTGLFLSDQKIMRPLEQKKRDVFHLENTKDAMKID